MKFNQEYYKLSNKLNSLLLYFFNLKLQLNKFNIKFKIVKRENIVRGKIKIKKK